MSSPSAWYSFLSAPRSPSAAPSCASAALSCACRLEPSAASSWQRASAAATRPSAAASARACSEAGARRGRRVSEMEDYTAGCARRLKGAGSGTSARWVHAPHPARAHALLATPITCASAACRVAASSWSSSRSCSSRASSAACKAPGKEVRERLGSGRRGRGWPGHSSFAGPATLLGGRAPLQDALRGCPQGKPLVRFP
jgi:hypothetical protein